MSSAISCPFCNYTFGTSDGLLKHKKAKHPIEFKNQYQNYICHFCSEPFRTHVRYIDHLKSKHANEFDLKFTSSSFPNKDEFCIWKMETESQTKSNFVAKRTPAIRRTCTNVTYYCNRVGTSRKSLSTGKRKPKNHGSRKTTRSCPAAMIVNIDQSGAYHVDFYGAHLDHDLNLQHLSLTQTDKLKLKEAIEKANFNKSMVLANFKNFGSNEEKKRINNIDHKDLNNIMYKFHMIPKGQNPNFDTNDGDDIYVDQFECLQRNIEFYKDKQFNPYAHVDIVFEECLDEMQFKVQKFNLLIMNDVQMELLKKFGSEMVCFDTSDQSYTPYSAVKLINILVFDPEKMEPIPVGHIYTLHNDDEENMITFFSKIREKCCENILSKLFICDMTSMQLYYDAWVFVMGPPTDKIICEYHLMRYWKSQIELKLNILDKMDEKEKRTLSTDIEKRLLNLIQILDQFEFEQASQDLQQFLNRICQIELAHSLNGILEYRHYWASCYRIMTDSIINKKIENFNRKFKNYFSKRQIPKRIDKAIDILLKYILIGSSGRNRTRSSNRLAPKPKVEMVDSDTVYSNLMEIYGESLKKRITFKHISQDKFELIKNQFQSNMDKFIAEIFE